jgi:hypothetical protein
LAGILTDDSGHEGRTKVGMTGMTRSGLIFAMIVSAVAALAASRPSVIAAGSCRRLAGP